MKHFVPFRWLLTALSVLTISSTYAAITVDWNNGALVSTTNGENNDNAPVRTSTAGGGNEDITLNINGDVFIDDNVYIAADSANTITVNITADAIVSADGSATENSVLRFAVTNGGGSVTVNVDNNLTYQGISSSRSLNQELGGNNERLLVLVHGASDANPAVDYQIADTKSVAITSETGEQATAAEHYVDIDDSGSENIVRYSRQSRSSSDVTVRVGSFGVMSYLTNNADDSHKARYQFDGNNDEANDGRLIWDVDNNARVNIRSIFNVQETEDFSSITFANLDKTLSAPAGGSAVAQLISASSWNGVLVTNNNQMMPELRSNPFCEDRQNPISLIQPGFIVGSNGSIQVSSGAYFDYVGLSINNPIAPNVPSRILDGQPINTVVKDRNASALFIDGAFNPFATSRAAFNLDDQSKMYFRSGVNADGNVEDTSTFLISPDNQPDGDNGYGHIVLDIEAPIDIIGDSFGNNAINVLSLEEANTGGSIFVDTSETNFKTRTFGRDANGELLQYAKASFLNNARAWMRRVALQHTDEIHRVFSNNTSRQSEATYIGGERLCDRDPNTSITREVSLSSGGSATTGIVGVELQLDHDSNSLDLDVTATFEGSTITTTISDNGTDTISGFDGRSIVITNDVNDTGTVFVTASGQAVIELKARQWRPAFVFNDAQLDLNTSAAFTGVDLLAPAIDPANTSQFRFFSNGFQVDQGTGRNLILGTNIGATAADGNTIVDRDAHLDVQQEFADASGLHVLALLTRQNDNQITEGLTANPGDRAGQYSVHAIYLAHGSNISVGADSAQGENPWYGSFFALNTNPTFYINGSFFSFESQGGRLNKPELSIISGQGGIFVGNNGIFELANSRRALFNAMIGRSFDGTVDLKERLASFGDGFGITQNNLDLRDTTQRNVVPAGSTVSDLVLDWKFATKDYANFTPYIPQGAPAAGDITSVTSANIASLPRVEGRVGQLQLQNSRLGDPAHVMVDGGNVRELVFMARQDGAMPQQGLLARDNQPDPAIAPVGVLAMENGAEVGIGPVPTRDESSEASVTLGTNGLTLVPNGNATVTLNSDVVIDNVAHIAPGPDFGARESQALTITSQTDRELRVKSNGVLDLSEIDTNSKKVAIGGKINVVAEPGARIILGGGELEITDEARVFAEQNVAGLTGNSSLTDTDANRVKINGSGRWVFSEDAQMQIPRDAIVGIEATGDKFISDNTGQGQLSFKTVDAMVTNLLWIFQDDAKLFIGSRSEFGGALQVGNVEDTNLSVEPAAKATVDFDLRLVGSGARMEVAGQGFYGMGAGIVNKPESAPNNWAIGSLFNVNEIVTDIREGKLVHNRIFDGDEDRASLLAISEAPQAASFIMDNTSSRVLGGGNMKKIAAGDSNVAPTVSGTNDDNTGILASKGILFDPSKFATSSVVTAQGRTVLGNDPQNPGGTPPAVTMAALFSYLKMNEVTDQAGPKAAIAERNLGQPAVGYVQGGGLIRFANPNLLDLFATSPDSSPALDRGIVGVAIGPSDSATFYNVVTA